MLMANECCSLKGAVRARIWLIAACCWAFVANVLVLCGVLGSSGVPTAIGCSVIVCVGVLWSSLPTTVTQKLRIRRPQSSKVTTVFSAAPVPAALHIQTSALQPDAMTYSPLHVKPFAKVQPVSEFLAASQSVSPVNEGASTT
jgi:hypothetical protein